MKKNDLVSVGGKLYRILGVDGKRVFAIDCGKKAMPQFFEQAYFLDAESADDIMFSLPLMDELTQEERKIAQQRFTMIAAAASVADDGVKRNQMLNRAAEQFGVSKQTLRTYLCTYLVHQDIAALAPRKRKEKELTTHQKNMRWALNKFFYTRNKNSLSTAYTMMLKEKYCDTNGQLLVPYPSFNQFRYFYRKTRKAEKFYITRDGIKDYQRNRRPLTGGGVQDFAPVIGSAMLDSTICDIYLVDEIGRLIGRPILVAACDANTSMCLAYSLQWEGGTYSLQNLMLNFLEDKVALCKQMGMDISPEQWPVEQLPGVIITDGGAEYVGQTFSQIAELGITLVKLPPYRPDLKGSVEKLFDLIQNAYKDVLKGKGVIMPDYQERGAHDYRRDAVLTLREFERIIVRCIVYYNCERVIRNYPYSPKMITEGVLPYANTIWNWKQKEEGANLIYASKRELVLTLLPRTTGKFTRFGLKVNRLRYYAEAYTEQFLKGGEAEVAFNPDNCSRVWLKEKDGSFVEFSLIENRFEGMTFSDVQETQKKQKQLEEDALKEHYSAKINLLSYIETVSEKGKGKTAEIKSIRSVRQAEKRKLHKDVGGEIDE